MEEMNSTTVNQMARFTDVDRDYLAKIRMAREMGRPVIKAKGNLPLSLRASLAKNYGFIVENEIKDE